MTVTKKVTCYGCRHYYVTWDNRRPYGCRVLGFKSKILPSIMVYRSSGTPCLYYKAKPPRKT